MKSLQSYLGVLIALTTALTQSARADFDCVSIDGNKTLVLYEPDPVVTRAYSATFRDGTALTSFKALPTNIDESFMFSRYEYKLWTQDAKEAALVIAARASTGRGGCGRGGCENGLKIITGKLTYEGVETSLSCLDMDI